MNEKTKRVCQKIWRLLGTAGYSISQGYDYCAVVPVVNDEKHNYVIRQWTDKASDCIKYIKERIPAKYVQSSYGRIYFKFDDSEIVAEVEKEIAEEKAKRLAFLNAIDLTPYQPSQKVLDKLIGYFAKGSKVNCGAIKSNEKLLTYYYAAYLLGWSDLKYWINEVGLCEWSWKDTNGSEYHDIIDAIELRVKPVQTLTRDKTEDRLLNFSKKIWQAVKGSGLDFDFKMINPTYDECWKDRTNGCAYTIAYLLRVGGTEIRFSDVTNEGCDCRSYGYQMRPCGFLMNKSELEERIISNLGLA